MRSAKHSHLLMVMGGMLVLQAAVVSTARAQILTMGEVPFQPVNNLTVKGVTFHDTAGAFYNSPNGGQMPYTQDPVIEGTTIGETLTVTFPRPVASFSFGFALSVLAPVANGATVKVFDAALNLIRTFTANAPIAAPFANGLFDYLGAPASQIEVTFNSGVAAAFGFDNLNLWPDAYQVSYAGNLTAGESVVNLTNAGSAPSGNICANVYVFAEDEQLIDCCSCPLTPNGLATLSVQKDLISNTLTPGVPTGVSIVLAASAPVGGTCDPSRPNNLGALEPGLRAWSTHLHQAPAGGYAETETAFSNVVPILGDLTRVTSLCGFIEANGSGYGICAACRAGAVGAAAK